MKFLVFHMTEWNSGRDPFNQNFCAELGSKSNGSRPVPTVSFCWSQKTPSFILEESELFRWQTVSSIGVRAPSDLGGRWPYCPKKLHNARKHVLYKRAQIAVKAKTFTILTSNERIIIRSVQNADCRLQTGYKMQTRYKMQTADCRLQTRYKMQTEYN